MNTEDIIKFENNAGNELHLFRDRLFWQAWERSAFLFSKIFRKYQVHHRFVQKVAQDLVWLGFPKTVLKDIQMTAKQKLFSYEVLDDSHIVIKGIPNIDGFQEWKSNILSSPSEDKKKLTTKETKDPSKKEAKTAEYLLYRLVSDFTIYASNLIPKINRSYRYPVGERIMNELLSVGEHIFLYINHRTAIDSTSVIDSLYRIRFDFRFLNELKQVSIDKWMFVNTKIEEILKTIMPESMSSRTHGASKEESSILPSSPGLPGDGFTPLTRSNECLF
jgi:hypothetical protein